MTVQECHIGMVTMLPMKYAETEGQSHRRPMAKATCIWIHPHGIYAVFQFDRSGIKETVYLDDEKKFAKNTPKPVVKIEEDWTDPNIKRVKDALNYWRVTANDVSRRAGRKKQYLTNRLARSTSMDDDETEFWLEMIEKEARERKPPVDPNDSHYILRLAIWECRLTQAEAARLLGHCESWLSERLRRPLSTREQTEMADELRKRAKTATECTESNDQG